ncbi:MAG: LysM peptidoglycan-binding domain-containing protein [Lachnospiraceae bacterium]|nr:LysM peptidoglycan-binding domain-containing protein [Lachnospiraceae bacterium]
MRTLISLNRRQALIGAIVLAAVMILFIGAFAIRTKAGSPAEYDGNVYYKYTTMYRVCDGDTLTSIAERYMDEIHYSSVSEYVSEVRKMNQMYYSDEIKAGELISICYYSTEYK